MSKLVKQIRDGAIYASIFQNNSEKGVFYSATYGRTYTSNEDMPKTASDFSGTDHLKIANLALKVYDEIAALRQSNKMTAE